MHITKWKIHIIYDSKFMTSWKKQKFEDIKKKKSVTGTSLVVQGLRPHAPNSGDLGWFKFRELDSMGHNQELMCHD